MSLRSLFRSETIRLMLVGSVIGTVGIGTIGAASGIARPIATETTR